MHRHPDVFAGVVVTAMVILKLSARACGLGQGLVHLPWSDRVWMAWRVSLVYATAAMLAVEKAR